MLNNLNKTSFANFGTVSGDGISAVSERLGYSIIKTRDVKYNRFKMLYFHPSKKTVLDIVDGNAIIFVGLSKDNLSAFLLDTTVIINPCVYFYIVPLISEAVIAVSEADGMQSLAISAKDKPETVIPYIEPKEIYTFFYHEKEPGFNFKGEHHDFWELTYVDRGEMYNVADGKTFKLIPGNVMFFTPNQTHSQYADKDVRVSYVTISFKMNDIPFEILSDTVFSPNGEIKSLIKKMIYESTSENIFADDLMLAYLKEIIIYLAREKRIENVIESSVAPMRASIEKNLVIAAKHYIGQNLSKHLTVTDVAKSIPVSDGYLSIIFKKNTGMTINAYITAKKMELAKTYIRENRYTFTQIAYMTGYSNVHYFSSCFKKHFGITPTEYSNSIKI